MKPSNADVSLLMMGLGPQSEDYYPTVVINALMKILRDSTLATHHTAVIQAVMFIFKALGLKCVPFLPQVCDLIRSIYSLKLLDDAYIYIYYI